MPDDDAFGIEVIDPRAFMVQWISMAKAMLDNTLPLMDAEADYHFATQMGCLTASILAVMASAPEDVKMAFEASSEMFEAAVGAKTDWVEVVHMSDDGATSLRIIAGGNLGRSLEPVEVEVEEVDVECPRCHRRYPHDPNHHGSPDLHSCVKLPDAD